MENNWYVYQHIRLDKNEPFYIGIGNKKNFQRAFEFRQDKRNQIWWKIYNKTNIKAEVIFENLSKQDLLQIIEFYKTKVSQQELSYLVLQLETNNKVKSLNDKIDSNIADYEKQIKDLKSHSLYLAELEKQAKDKEIQNIIKKYEKTEKKINTKTEKK